MDSFVGPVAIVHGLSLLYMIVMILQFYRIYRKRVQFLQTFDTQGEMATRLHSERLQSYFAIFLYVIFTIVITVVSTVLFFIRPHWL